MANPDEDLISKGDLVASIVQGFERIEKMDLESWSRRLLQHRVAFAANMDVIDYELDDRVAQYAAKTVYQQYIHEQLQKEQDKRNYKLKVDIKDKKSKYHMKPQQMTEAEKEAA